MQDEGRLVYLMIDFEAELRCRVVRNGDHGTGSIQQRCRSLVSEEDNGVVHKGRRKWRPNCVGIRSERQTMLPMGINIILGKVPLPIADVRVI